MNRIKNFLAISAFSLLMLGLPAVASAQWGGNNGGYGNGGYNQDIRGTVQNLKNRARSFEQMTNQVEDRNDDRGGNRNGSWGNQNGGWGNNRNGNYGGDIGRLENLADDFKKATDKLEDKYGNGRNLNNSRDEAQRVLSIASQIDNEINQTRNRNLQNQWNQMRNDLNMVANVYGGSYNNGGYNNGNNGNGNRNRNGNRNGDWRNRVPFPLPF
ncbi:MAG TPA: hypothetical protein VK612_08595 [Pyrinomonadaceae bacterium]|nr:hypothetical protein [Pyrinomonadaceae bacterium]